MKLKLVLFGPLYGKTVALRSGGRVLQFVDGTLEVPGGVDQWEGMIKYLGRCYQAFLEGTEEYEKAKRAHDLRCGQYRQLCQQFGLKAEGDCYGQHARMVFERAKKEGTDGEFRVQKDPQPGTTEALQRDLRPAGSGPPEGAASLGFGHAGAEGRDPGLRTDGEKRPGASANAAPDPALIRKALRELDPENEELWCANGQPAVGPVNVAMKRVDVTRLMIDLADPTFNRTQARSEAEHRNRVFEMNGD